MSDTLTTVWDGPRFAFTIICDPTLTFRDDINKLGEMCEPFLEQAARDLEEANAVQIALEELLTNLAKFGLNPQDEKHVLSAQGELIVSEHDIRLTITDNGCPFNPAARRLPTFEDDAGGGDAAGGLGLVMLFQMFHHHRYARRDDRNINIWSLVRKRTGESSK